MTRPLAIPLADYERVIDQRDMAEARLMACVTALSAVMRTLRGAAGSPAEAKAWAAARGLLAESGIGAAEAAEYQAAWEERERLRVARENRRATLADKHCTECGCRHVLDEFQPGSRVRTLVDKTAPRHVAMPAGTVCVVREWSQYGAALYYRVHVEDDESVRENYDPCELEAV